MGGSSQVSAQKVQLVPWLFWSQEENRRFDPLCLRLKESSEPLQ